MREAPDPALLAAIQPCALKLNDNHYEMKKSSFNREQPSVGGDLISQDSKQPGLTSDITYDQGRH